MLCAERGALRRRDRPPKAGGLHSLHSPKNIPCIPELSSSPVRGCDDLIKLCYAASRGVGAAADAASYATEQQCTQHVLRSLHSVCVSIPMAVCVCVYANDVCSPHQHTPKPYARERARATAHPIYAFTIKMNEAPSLLRERMRARGVFAANAHLTFFANVLARARALELCTRYRGSIPLAICCIPVL